MSDVGARPKLYNSSAVTLQPSRLARRHWPRLNPISISIFMRQVAALYPLASVLWKTAHNLGTFGSPRYHLEMSLDDCGELKLRAQLGPCPVSEPDCRA